MANENNENIKSIGYNNEFIKCDRCPEMRRKWWKSNGEIVETPYYKGRNGEKLCRECAGDTCWKCGWREKISGLRQGYGGKESTKNYYMPRDYGDANNRGITVNCSKCFPNFQEEFINEKTFDDGVIKWTIERINPENQVSEYHSFYPDNQEWQVTHEPIATQLVTQQSESSQNDNSKVEKLVERKRSLEEELKKVCEELEELNVAKEEVSDTRLILPPSERN